MVNWHLSKQNIRWPALRDHIAGLTLELIESYKAQIKIFSYPGLA